MTTLLFFLAMVSSVAQNNSISGTVVDNNNELIVGVNVIIQGTNKGVQTDINGKFEIKKVPASNQKLVISFIGFKTKIITVTPPSNLTIILSEGNELLQEVQVTSRNNKFSRKKTAYVSKLPLKDLENSQVYSTVTSELLESQIITNVEDALVNSTGISKLWEATGRAPGEGTGYFAVRGFATQPQLVDGMPGFTLSALDPSYIERIEVVKGPSATLFGSTATSLGGLINIVTKKPYKGLGGSVSFTGGSFGLNRFSLDYNTPLSHNERTYFRLNATNLSQDSFQDAGFRNSFFVAPSITHKVNNRLNISFGLEFAKTSQTNPAMLFVNRLGQGRLTTMLTPFGITPTVPTNVTELNIDPKKSFTSNDIALNSLNFNTRSIVDYKVSNEWSSQTIFASSYARTKGFYQYNIDGGAAAIMQLAPLLSDPRLAAVNPIIAPIITPMLAESATLLASPSFTRIFDKRNANATNYNIQQNFIGDFKIGDLRNRFVGGLDFVNRSQHSRNQNGNPILTTTPGFSQLLGFFNNPQAAIPFPLDSATIGALQATGQQIGAGFNAFPYFDAFLDAQGNVKASTFTPNAIYSPTKVSLENVFKNIPVNDFKTNSKTYAAYISNVLNITPKLTVNLGLRLDYFDQDGNTSTTADDYTKTTLSPKAGIVYQVIPNELSVFGNYQTGFVNKNPVITQTGIQNFKPIKANQFEGGIKTNLFNNKLNLGVSYYHITANNITTTDPTAFLTTNQIDLKEVVSKGIELEANSNPFTGLNLRASYSYNNSKVTDANSVFGKRNVVELLNRRPEESGPKTTYNFWADYKFQEVKFLKNIGLGAGFNGASEHLTINNAISGTFTLHSYTVFNAGAYYDTNKIRVGLKINNLTNKTYYKGWSTVNAQAPRAFLGTVTYKF